MLEKFIILAMNISVQYVINMHENLLNTVKIMTQLKNIKSYQVEKEKIAYVQIVLAKIGKDFFIFSFHIFRVNLL